MTDPAPRHASALDPVPLVVGLVGHRNPAPEHLPAVREQLSRVLTQLQGEYRHTPIVLLCCLAEGADLSAAEVASDQGVRVIAALPFEPAVYRRSTSFSSDEARTQFDRLLLARSLQWFVVQADGKHPVDGRSDRNDDEIRRAGYEAAGEFVVRRCQALIALWDGSQNGGAAGTAAMVQRKLTGIFSRGAQDPEELSDTAALGPVIHIDTPRAGQASAATVSTRWLWPTSTSAEPGSERSPGAAQERIFRRNCAALDEFNRALADEKADGRATPAASEQFGGNCRHSSVHLHRLAAIRETAARLSRRAAADLRRGVVMVFAMIFLAVTCFHIYSHLHHHWSWLALFLLTLLGTWRTVRTLREREMRALDGRMIAEALRVQCQWAHAGLGHDIGKHYLHQFRGEVAWIRQLLQALDLPPQEPSCNFARLAIDEQMRCLSTVRERWVAVQRRFFHDRFEQYHRSNTFLRRAGFGLAVAGWLLATPAFFLAPGHGTESAPRFEYVLFSSGMLVVGGGLLLAYAERRLLEELVRQYGRMRDIFVTADERLQKILAGKDVGRAQALLLELGRESLTENASWLMLRRARPVEMPVH